jgi:bifunctional ADP-heptose synthase (sugar kinase/adenylyltransferase)
LFDSLASAQNEGYQEISKKMVLKFAGKKLDENDEHLKILSDYSKGILLSKKDEKQNMIKNENNDLILIDSVICNKIKLRKEDISNIKISEDHPIYEISKKIKSNSGEIFHVSDLGGSELKNGSLKII